MADAGAADLGTSAAADGALFRKLVAEGYWVLSLGCDLFSLRYF